MMNFLKKTYYLKIIFINLALCLIAIEIILQLVNYNGFFMMGVYKNDGMTLNEHFTFDTITGYSLIKNITDQTASITTDENGNRISSKKFSKNLKSIVFVGDSTVFGYGVKDDETFIYKLSNDPYFQDYNLVNLGVPSYSIGHIAAVLKNKVKKYNPAIVIVAVLWPWKAFEHYGGENNWLTIDFDYYKNLFPIRENFISPAQYKKRFKIPTLIRDIKFYLYRDALLEKNFSRPGIRDFTISHDEEVNFAKKHVEKLLQIKNSDELKNIKILFYIHPYQYTIFHPDYQNLGAIGYKILLEGLQAKDLKPIIRNKYTGIPLYLDGSHLTPEGHDVFYNIMKDTIIKNLDEI